MTSLLFESTQPLAPNRLPGTRGQIASESPGSKNEERTWIAALSIIGYETDALQHTSIYQVWGGETTECKSSMKNAILTQNSSICYKTEDFYYTHQQQEKEQHYIRSSHHDIKNQEYDHVTNNFMYFYGNETWNQLKTAHQRGYMFARKFVSNHTESVTLLQRIQNELWKQHVPINV